MWIDIHAHAMRVPVPTKAGAPWLSTPEQMIACYDGLDIEKGVLLPVVSPECFYAVQSVDDVIDMANDTGRFIPFCNVDPRGVSNSTDADLGHVLRHWRDKGCKGIGEITANLPFLHPKMQNLFKHVQDVGFPLTFHVAAHFDGFYGIYDAPGLPQLERTLALFPDLKFFAHSQAFWAEMAELETVGERTGYPKHPITKEGAVPRLMRKYPNLYGDLSAGSGCNALARDEAYAVRFLDEFQDRLLFGLDVCAPPGKAPLVDLLKRFRESGKISEEVLNKVTRENAVRLLDL